MKKIICMGAGLAGLATCWHLLDQSKTGVRLDLYDPQGIGQGASALCSGMLHPFTGRHAKKSLYAQEGLEHTHRLLAELSCKELIQSKGIFRPAMTLQQQQQFMQRAQEYPQELQWWDQQQAIEYIPGLRVDAGGLWIKDAITLYTKRYLEKLWELCNRLGCCFHQDHQVQQDLLEQTDAIIFACGASILQIPFLSHLPIYPLQGALLSVLWPQNMPSLRCSINAHGYITSQEDTVVLGSTFERLHEPYSDAMRIAKIQESVAAFFPQITSMQVVQCRHATRATTTTHLPLIGRYGKNVWFITGLGSKGLLYHSYAGKVLAQAILANDSSMIPEPLRYET